MRYIIGTLRGGFWGEGDKTSLNRPYEAFVRGIKAPYPPPTPLRVLMSIAVIIGRSLSGHDFPEAALADQRRGILPWA